MLSSVAHCWWPYRTFLTGGRGECRERFRSGDVDLRMRKIRYAADMVRVEVRDHNVADVLKAEAELVDLVRRRFGGHQHGSGDEPDRPHSSRRIGAVVQAETGIDEDQPVVCLDEQHVTDTRGSAGKVHRAAVEVVNLHCSPTRASTSPRPICVTRLAESK